MFEWRFKHLNASFDEVFLSTSRTLLVYSDVVDSNVVGDAEHPLRSSTSNRITFIDAFTSSFLGRDRSQYRQNGQKTDQIPRRQDVLDLGLSP